VLLAARDDTLHYRPCTEDLDLLERELTALTGSDLLQESASIIDRFAIGTQEGEFGCEDDRKEIAVPGVLRLVDAAVEGPQDLLGFCHMRPFSGSEFRAALRRSLPQNKRLCERQTSR